MTLFTERNFGKPVTIWDLIFVSIVSTFGFALIFADLTASLVWYGIGALLYLASAAVLGALPNYWHAFLAYGLLTAISLPILIITLRHKVRYLQYEYIEFQTVCVCWMIAGTAASMLFLGIKWISLVWYGGGLIFWLMIDWLTGHQIKFVTALLIYLCISTQLQSIVMKLGIAIDNKKAKT